MALVEPDVAVTPLPREEADLARLREHPVCGGEQRPADALALPIGGDRETAEMHDIAVETQAHGTEQTALLAHAELDDGRLGELRPQLLDGLVEREHIQLVVHDRLAHECGTLQREHLARVGDAEHRDLVVLPRGVRHGPILSADGHDFAGWIAASGGPHRASKLDA